MLRPLIYLSALSLLAGAVAQISEQQTIIASSVLNSSCPFNFYGQTYQQIYVTISNDTFAICFNGFYNPQSRGDCIVGPQFPFNQITFYTSKYYYSTHYSCEIRLYTTYYYYLNFPYTQFYLYNSDTQSLVYLYDGNQGSWVYDVQVSGVTVDKLNVTNTQSHPYSSYVADIRGCRHSGVVYKPGAVVTSDPVTCYSLTCDASAVLCNVTCDPSEHCQGNGICMSGACTVTGPTVIDFYGQLNSIQDLCTYSLLSRLSDPSFQVLANFQERRRKDVSFVDSVALVLSGSGIFINLGQGGVVQVNGVPLALNSSTQLVGGVELSKERTGVTAKLSLSNYTASILFDGYTAQIRAAGPAGSLVSGLCRNSSVSLREVRMPEYSVSGCEILYNDTADSSINCSAETQRCNLLRASPFASCNGLIDPQPYINACVDTMCRYPSVDDLDCQFPQAYARACSLLGNGTVGNWWSVVGCSPPQAYCPDRVCSSHEFCARSAGGGSSCFCRALFAANYSSAGALGDPTVCSSNSASITVVGCLLEEKNIRYSALHLNDRRCRGQMDELTHMLTFSFNTNNTCGAVITNNDSYITYSNAITDQYNSSDIIVRHDQVYIDFSCYYTQPQIKSISFRIKTNSVVQHITSGAWSYTLTMTSYTDTARTQALSPSSEVVLDQRIWVELKTDGLDGSVVAVVTDSCWATSDSSPSGSLRYDLIVNGCPNPADQTVQMQENGLWTSNYFSFDMFQFSEQSADVYLHCNVQLCVRGNSSCIPVCSGAARRRRFARRRPAYEEEAAAFISMAWTNQLC
ncbi:alpha-tectorin-like [Betta splendens]|uniref:Alpha-tectorin-like n=1 Tax=Betta splendens TaxID=158456 RepID=A0A6P7P5R4_BETSP|nr:alpha-tectorin-like [Betta splendens]XP_029025559.1 alpha-tectorin-like [Betta splendens]